MGESEYDGRNLFDFERWKALAADPGGERASFMGVAPSTRREWNLSRGAIRSEMQSPGRRRMRITVESDRVHVVRWSLSRRWWAVLLAWTLAQGYFYFATDDGGVVAGSLFVAVCALCLLSLWFFRPGVDHMFEIDDDTVTMRNCHWSTVVRPTADIQRCEYAWSERGGFDSSHGPGATVVFTDGQRFGGWDNLEILKAVHWFRPDVPLLQMARDRRSPRRSTLQPPLPRADGNWREYVAMRDTPSDDADQP
ncbi:MAG: hypothetical protein WBG57_07085 [Ornithinimicrobium sp.]